MSYFANRRDSNLTVHVEGPGRHRYAQQVADSIIEPYEHATLISDRSHHPTYHFNITTLPSNDLAIEVARLNALSKANALTITDLTHRNKQLASRLEALELAP